MDETWFSRVRRPDVYIAKVSDCFEDNIIKQYALLAIQTFKPLVNFNYIFGTGTNLRIDYKIDYKKEETPYIINTLDTRFNRYVAETQLMYSIDFGGNSPVNDKKINYL